MATHRDLWWENDKKGLRRPAPLVVAFICATWTAIARTSGIGEVEFLTVDAVLLAAMVLGYVVVQRLKRS